MDCLGIELKTIPVDAGNSSRWSLYLGVPLMNKQLQSWDQSVVGRNSVSGCIEGSRDIPLAERRLGMGFIWQPDEALRLNWADYDEQWLGYLWSGGYDYGRTGTFTSDQRSIEH